MKRVLFLLMFVVFTMSCSLTSKVTDKKNIIKAQKSIVTVYGEKDRPATWIDDLIAILNGEKPTPIVTDKWMGSGSVLNKEDGFIVTNKHVAPNLKGVRIFVKIDGMVIKGNTIYNHRTYDLAVVKVDPFFLKKKLNIVFGKDPAIGDEIGVLGHPYGLYSTFTFGHVSAYRLFEDGWYIQTDAHVNPGNSGGMAYNVYGEFVGIPSAGIPGAGIAFILSGDLIKHSLFVFLPENKKFRKSFPR